MAFGQSSGPPASAATATPKPAPREHASRQLEEFSDEQLAAELQRRGWVVLEP